MQIKQVTVSAGRTFNHPYESYSNFRHHVELIADVLDGESPEESTKALQAKAESMVEDHKQNLLRSVRELREMTEMQSEISSLETSLKRGQERLEELRKAHPSTQPLLPISTDAQCCTSM